MLNLAKEGHERESESVRMQDGRLIARTARTMAGTFTPKG